MPRKTIAQVQDAFLNRTPAKTTNLESDAFGSLLSYGYYEIARWVRTCRLHGPECPDAIDLPGRGGKECCPAAKTRLIVRNNGNRGWYSVTTAAHARSVQSHPDAQLAREVTPRREYEIRI